MRIINQIALGIFLAQAVTLNAQEVTFEASVDRTTIGTGDRLQLTFILSNAGMGGGKNLVLPDLSNFYVLSGPNQSSSMQIINGSVSSSISYGYILQPKDSGSFVIGPATIEVEGTRHSSKPITLQVVQGKVTSSAPSGSPGGRTPSGIAEDDLFLRATVDRTRVMQGEQINLTYTLYTRIAVQNYIPEKNPALTGFWSEDVESPKNVPLTTETVNGKQYQVGVVRRVALFPTQSGKLEISPMEIKAIVRLQNRRLDPFDSFFRDPFGRSVEHVVKSGTVRIDVTPLPAGAPDSFKGAVGQFAMTSTVDNKNTRANEPVTLTITVSGTGNIKLLESPVLELPTDFEQFSPKVTDRISNKGGAVTGSKTFEYLVIPRYPGRKTIKPVRFSYYDLRKKQYVTLASDPIQLDIQPGISGGTGPSIAGPVREGVQVLSQDIRFIRTTADLVPVGSRLFSPLVLGILAFLPAAGFAVLLLLVRRKGAEEKDSAGYRNRRAIGVARKRLKKAKQLLGDAANYVPFFEEVARAVWSYLGDKLALDRAALSIDTVVTRLSGRNVDGGITSALREILELCERARFAPAGEGESDMQRAFDEAGRIIVEIEQQLRGR